MIVRRSACPSLAVARAAASAVAYDGERHRGVAGDGRPPARRARRQQGRRRAGLAARRGSGRLEGRGAGRSPPTSCSQLVRDAAAAARRRRSPTPTGPHGTQRPSKRSSTGLAELPRRSRTRSRRRTPTRSPSGSTDASRRNAFAAPRGRARPTSASTRRYGALERHAAAVCPADRLPAATSGSPAASASRCRAGSSSWGSDRPAPTTSCRSRARALDVGVAAVRPHRRAIPRSTSSPPTASRSSRSTSVYDAAPDLEAAYARDRGARCVAAAARARRGRLRGAGQPGGRRAHGRAAARRRRASRSSWSPGVSFADLAWVRLGVDPMDGDARVVDGRAIDDAELAGPLLDRAVRQRVRALRREARAARAPRPRHAGHGAAAPRPARRARRHRVALEELDRGAVVPDHLTSVFVDAGAAGAAREMVRLFQLAKRLRDPGGCPWDAEQTHHSLTRYLLEESYEVVEAVEALPADGAIDPRRTPRSRTSSATCSTRWCSTRCSRRRPARSPWPTSRAASTTSSCAATRTCSATSWPTRPSDVMRNWEQIKKEEKGTTSIVDGHHARAAVAPLHAQAVPQGGVGRPRPRRRSTRRSTASTPRSRGSAPAATTSRPTSRRCWRRRSSWPAPVASTPSPRCAAGPRRYRAPLRGDGAPRARPRPRPRRPRPPVALWLEPAPTALPNI